MSMGHNVIVDGEIQLCQAHGKQFMYWYDTRSYECWTATAVSILNALDPFQNATPCHVKWPVMCHDPKHSPIPHTPQGCENPRYLNRRK